MRKEKAISIVLACLCLSAHAQGELADMKTFFASHLEGSTAAYTESTTLSWSGVEAQRAQVWQAWCEANLEFEEDKLPSLRPLTNADTLLWPLPEALEPSAVMPYYYGSKGDKPAEGWPLYL